ncbi:hypothetical protein J5J10_15330 [Ciceribacter sp. L1K23]|uniref:hypothetical protein n=1 Tax=unclassified Ciceribacter TaxID=2628820 RepID=UPI001ABEE034|nr:MULTISPECIES: hypothetical protein [unclassified Ciceribacter]MBO3761412.1 hypothetical protein [Ciceribacter sp. L1K22]MBR0557059.1 hypothetical protein [Ciceribacter sp. L1K23]
MAIKKPRDGAAGTTDQSPRWEGPQENTPSGYLPAKDDPDHDRDAVGENLQDPRKKTVSDGLKTGDDDNSSKGSRQ